MSHRVDFTLTDEEYAALASESVQSGKPIEDLLHELLCQHIQPSALKRTHSLTHRDIQSYLYEEGVTEYIPIDEPTMQDDEAERQHLAHLFGQGKPVSDMAIEDRGSHAKNTNNFSNYPTLRPYLSVLILNCLVLLK